MDPYEYKPVLTPPPEAPHPTAPSPQKTGGLTGLVVGLRGRIKAGNLAKFARVAGIVIALVALAGGTAAIYLFRGTKSQNAVPTQNIDLSQIKTPSGDYSLGTTGQKLVVGATSDFRGKVTVNDIDVNGNANLGSLTASGTTNLQGVNIKNNLAVSGSSNLQGDTNIGGALTVGGASSFGSLSTKTLSATSANIGSSLSISGDLVVGGHLRISGGAKPSASPGSGVSGVSIVGNDSAGTITMTVGGSGASGALMTATFAAALSGVPKVLITPDNAESAKLQYFVSKSASAFSINTGSTAPAGSTISFDYYIIP